MTRELRVAFFVYMIENAEFNLERFVMAQRNTYSRTLGEIAQGRKTSHWMWFIFPQVAGLGNSEMSRKYAIAGINEARAYLAHEILGARLRECVSALSKVENRSAFEIFGLIDEMKFRSSLTLFEVASNEPIFIKALEKFFEGAPDPKTLKLLGINN